MQKKVGNALYVFDTTPFTITEDTNVEVIYVQNECLKGYLELNTELESKIKTFNQWVVCVNAPWADGGTTEPTYHVNFSTDSNASADIEIDPQDQFAGKNVYIRFKNNQSSSTITVTSSDVELTYDQPNDEYYFTMPSNDVTIKAVYANA